MEEEKKAEDSSDFEAVEREMDEKAEEMEEREEELEEGIQKVSDEWERNRKDSSVPGAPPPEDEEK
jgi:uncharacterized protein YukE